MIDAFAFARMVEARRDLIRGYCSTCGMTFTRWAGCTDRWHSIPHERAFGLYTEASNTNDPGTCLPQAPGRDRGKDPRYG